MTISVQEETCPKCHLPMIEACAGRGYIRVDEGTTSPCPRILARQLRNHLGREIADVRYVPSPLFVLDKNRQVVEDATQKNLFIRTEWPGFLPHLQWVLAHKGILFVFRVVTDTKIKSVFVGDEQYKARPAHMREDTLTFNNLEDLVGSSVDLVIIKLGYLGYKNKAASGALLEALLVRDAHRKPTWVIDDSRSGYEWNHSRSPEVEEYLSRFDQIDIAPVASDRPEKDAGILVDEGDDEALLQDPEPVVVPVRNLARPRPEPRLEVPSSSEGLGDFLDGKKSVKKFGKKKGGGW